MSRISEKFEGLKEKGDKALIIYITLGDPDIELTRSLVFTLEDAGADVIELGIPFSDPIADGPIIQGASNRALKGGASLKKALDFLGDIRLSSKIPLIFMGYYNPFFRYGINEFVENASELGLDGVIIPDLPPDEGEELISAGRRFGLDTIFLLAPTSTVERIELISKVSTGFIYYVSYTGITGSRDAVADEILPMVSRIRENTGTPIATGFGISNKEQAYKISRFVDGVIVGSAVVKIIEKGGDRRDIISEIEDFVRDLKTGIRG